VYALRLCWFGASLDCNEENADNGLELLGCLLQNTYKANQEICPEAIRVKKCFQCFFLRRGCLVRSIRPHTYIFLSPLHAQKKDVTGPCFDKNFLPFPFLQGCNALNLKKTPLRVRNFKPF
jgi:hypothetical protein